MKTFLRYLVPAAWLLAGAMVLSLGPGCNTISECTKIQLALQLACSADPESAECKEAKQLLFERCGGPDPAPTPTPEPTPEPTPTPAPPPPPIECGPDEIPVVVDGEVIRCDPKPAPPEPPASAFPVRFPKPGTRIFFNNQPLGKGLHSTPKAEGDPDLCLALHGVRVNICHFDSTVWTGPDQRAAYEMRVLAGAREGDSAEGAQLCPTWQRKRGSFTVPCSDNRAASENLSCDHFGHDDPNTPGFEGSPAQCGNQRDEFGPNAAFWMQYQGFGEVRACPPLDQAGPNCGPWKQVRKD